MLARGYSGAMPDVDHREAAPGRRAEAFIVPAVAFAIALIAWRLR
jgi:hypothetical protein